MKPSARTRHPRRIAGGRRTIWSGAVITAAAITVAGLAIGVAPSYGAALTDHAAQARPAASPVPARHARPVAGPVPARPAAPAKPKAGHAASRPSLSAKPVAQAPARSAAPSPVARTQRSDETRVRLSGSQRATEHGDRPALEFVAADRADVARGAGAVDCLHAEGVDLVELSTPDDQGISYLAFGGQQNDQRSISLGLRFADACIAAAAR